MKARNKLNNSDRKYGVKCSHRFSIDVLQKAFLPTMPQDEIAEIKEALLATRKRTGENPVLYRKFIFYVGENSAHCQKMFMEHMFFFWIFGRHGYYFDIIYKNETYVWIYFERCPLAHFVRITRLKICLRKFCIANKVKVTVDYVTIYARCSDIFWMAKWFVRCSCFSHVIIHLLIVVNLFLTVNNNRHLNKEILHTSVLCNSIGVLYRIFLFFLNRQKWRLQISGTECDKVHCLIIPGYRYL